MKWWVAPFRLPRVASRLWIARTTAGDQWKADLNHGFYLKRYWFTGKEFLEWVAKWFRREITKGFAFQKSSHHNGVDDNGLGAAQGESDESLQTPR